MKKSGEDRSWSFLVASPKLNVPIFDESVILILEDSEDGTLGVILNKPMDKTLDEIDKSFSTHKYKELSQAEVFDGGPICKDKLSIAVWYDDESELGNFSFGLTPEKAEAILANEPNSQAAVFSGYSGWSKGQLDAEIKEGSWITAHADLGLINHLTIDELWEDLVIKNNPIFEQFPIPPAHEGELN